MTPRDAGGGTFALKFNIAKPRCDGLDCFVDNRKADKGRRVYNRSLMPGERYCVFDKKVRRFKKRDARYSVPRWCPRLHKSLVIHVYAREPESLFDLMCRQQFGEDWEPPVLPSHYFLRATAGTGHTALQFAKELTAGLCDYMDLMGYYPKQGDVMEIDNGVTAAYLRLNKRHAWEQIYSFDATQCDDGSVGGYAVRPHAGLTPGRYSHSTDDFARGCVGYIRGYFAVERFHSHLQDNRYELAGPDLWKEHEALVDALRTQGFLRSREKLAEYCRRFQQGAIPGSKDEYGYTAETQEHIFYIRCLPLNDNYNVYLYVYRKDK